MYSQSGVLLFPNEFYERKNSVCFPSSTWFSLETANCRGKQNRFISADVGAVHFCISWWFLLSLGVPPAQLLSWALQMVSVKCLCPFYPFLSISASFLSSRTVAKRNDRHRRQLCVSACLCCGHWGAGLGPLGFLSIARVNGALFLFNLSARPALCQASGWRLTGYVCLEGL